MQVFHLFWILRKKPYISLFVRPCDLKSKSQDFANQNNSFLMHSQDHTFPIVRPWSPEQDKVVVWGETDRQPLLTEAKLLVSLRTALAELPLPSVQVISLRQVLAQHVAAADGVASFRGFVHPLPELVEVSAGLAEDRRHSSCF